jgi:hypothetical protein
LVQLPRHASSLRFLRRWLGLERLELARSRRDADRCLLDAEAGAPTSSAFAWRVAELTNANQRRTLARSLRGVVDDLSAARLPGAAPPSRKELRQHADLLVALAERLEQRDGPVTAKGMLLVRELLSDGGSPLYLYGNAEELPSELARIDDALDGR